MINKEIRSFNIETNEKDTRKVGGYAIVFNSLSVDLGGFREIISPDAITQDLIDNSDIIFNYNHDNNYMLGRSRRGEGTLTLRLDEVGLYFECELPNSPMGDNIRESIHRGDLSQCSFAFSIDTDDEGAESWEQREDGIYRTINRIAGLYDVSCVNFPAYEETSISERAKNIIQQMNTDELKLREAQEDEDVKDETLNDENIKDEEEKSTETEETDEEQKEVEDEEENTDEEEQEDENDDDTQNRETKKTNNTNTRNSKTMEKRFSLLKAIREVANGQKLDDATQAVVNAGAEAMRNAGQPFSGQIQLPVAEMREDPQPVHYTVEADGEHVVVTDYLNILEPLKAKNVLVNAGATYLTGLTGNLQIPSMSAENVYWEGEIDETENGAGSFSHVNMAPRRLSAFIDISKQFLVQDTLGAENLIRKLLVEAINDKLEETILSDDASSGAKPAGLFYNVTPSEIADYSDLCDFESDLEDANFTGEMKYVLSPKAKAALRSMIKGTNATGMIMENDSVDGTPVEVTTNIESGNFAYGDWSNLYIGQWGGIDLVVDNFTQATKGCVRLVINAFFDYKVVRDGAIVLGKISRD